MAPPIGSSRRYDHRYLFAVEIEGLEVAWFEKAGPLEAELDVVEVHEGGNIRAASKDPGKVKYTPIVLQVGTTDNVEMFQWFKAAYDGANNSGEVDALEKKNLTIAQKNRAGKVLRRFPVFGAWVSKYKAGDWDAKSSEASMEEVTLTYDYFTRSEGAV